MAKFNVVQKRRRALIAEKKRQLHGDPSTAKLKIREQPHSISGKRKRKLFKKWRRVLHTLSFSILHAPNFHNLRFHFSGAKGRHTEWVDKHGRCSNGGCWRYLLLVSWNHYFLYHWCFVLIPENMFANCLILRAGDTKDTPKPQKMVRLKKAVKVRVPKRKGKSIMLIISCSILH